MPRIVPALVVIGLLAATAVAFAVTERLKLVRSPILATELDRGVFSPVCGCESRSVELGFRLRKADRLTVTVVDSDGRVVRTLIGGEPTPAGPVVVRWDGRSDGGDVVAEGAYKPRVHLAGQRRTIELPNPMRVDTTAPSVVALEVRPEAFSPDGDGRRDKVGASYELSEEGRALLSVNGELRVRGRGRELEGKVEWHGLDEGRGLPAGVYRLTLAAVDQAGNIGEAAGPVEVAIRYAELTRDTYRVRAGARFVARVRTDAESYAWRLARSSGSSSSRRLVLRAPEQPGRYALVVEANGRRMRAEVIVRAR
ncbi:MAG: FlgD immunoglobulin-like domain containing protein [Gaiellaceae bacterium]